MKVGIIGAGLTGLELARSLKERGIDFIVFEKENQIGGLAKTIRTGDYLWDYGVHAMYSKDKSITDWDNVPRDAVIVRSDPLIVDQLGFDGPENIPTGIVQFGQAIFQICPMTFETIANHLVSASLELNFLSFGTFGFSIAGDLRHCALPCNRLHPNCRGASWWGVPSPVLPNPRRDERPHLARLNCPSRLRI